MKISALLSLAFSSALIDLLAIRTPVSGPPAFLATCRRVEQFCLYQFKQRGRVKGGVEATRWVLERFLQFVRQRVGRHARVTDLTGDILQQWMDYMAATDLVLSTMRTRQATLSSLCAWLVKRGILTTNRIAKMDRPPHRSEPPRQVPSGALMDALIEAARGRQRPRDMAIFLILRYSGMRRESVATLRIRHLDATWGLRGVLVKGGRTRDIPLPAAVMQFLRSYVELIVSPQGVTLDADTPVFWSSWGRRGVGKTSSADDGEKQLAALQSVRSNDWRADAEAA